MRYILKKILIATQHGHLLHFANIIQNIQRVLIYFHMQ
jgi:hypothetical protein